MKNNSAFYSNEIIDAAIEDVLKRSILNTDDEKFEEITKILKSIILNQTTVADASALNQIEFQKLEPLAAAVDNLLKRGKLERKLQKINNKRLEKEQKKLEKLKFQKQKHVDKTKLQNLLLKNKKNNQCNNKKKVLKFKPKVLKKINIENTQFEESKIFQNMHNEKNDLKLSLKKADAVKNFKSKPREESVLKLKDNSFSIKLITPLFDLSPQKMSLPDNDEYDNEFKVEKENSDSQNKKMLEKNKNVMLWLKNLYTKENETNNVEENQLNTPIIESKNADIIITKRRKNRPARYQDIAFDFSASNQILIKKENKNFSINEQISSNKKSKVNLNKTSGKKNLLCKVEQNYSKEEIAVAVVQILNKMNIKEIEFDNLKEAIEQLMYKNKNYTVHQTAKKFNFSLKKLSQILKKVKQVLEENKVLQVKSQSSVVEEKNDKSNILTNLSDVNKQKTKENSQNSSTITLDYKNKSLEKDDDNLINEKNSFSKDTNIKKTKKLIEQKKNNITSTNDGEKNLNENKDLVINEGNKENLKKHSKKLNKGDENTKKNIKKRKLTNEESVNNDCIELVSDILNGQKRRRRSKVTFPNYWLNYPKIVNGVIDEILQRCTEQNLRQRLTKALKNHFFEKATNNDSAKDNDVVVATLNRYSLITKDLLRKMLGRDKMCSFVENFLNENSVSYTEFKEFFKKNESVITQYHVEDNSSAKNDFIKNKEIQKTPENEYCFEEKNVESVNQTSKLLKTKYLNLLPNLSQDMFQKSNVTEFSESNIENKNSPLSVCASVNQQDQKNLNTLFSPSSQNQSKRLFFRGTITELRAEVKNVLQNRYNEDLNNIVDIVMGAIIKEIKLRLAMEKTGITVDLLLSAYSFCGRYIALDKVDITNIDDSISHFCNQSKTQSSLVELNSTDLLPTICKKLFDAFEKNTKEENQFKCIINYVVEVSYKRAIEERNKLKLCLETILIDGLSLKGALSETPHLRQVVVLEYSQKCQKAHNFFLIYTPLIFTKTEEKNKQLTTENNINYGILSNFLNYNCIQTIFDLIQDLKKIDFKIVKEFVVELIKTAINAQSDVSNASTFTWDQSMNTWLNESKILNKLTCN